MKIIFSAMVYCLFTISAFSQGSTEINDQSTPRTTATTWIVDDNIRNFFITVSDAVSTELTFELPDVDASNLQLGTTIHFTIDDTSDDFDYALVPADPLHLQIYDYPATRYFLDKNEVAVFILSRNGGQKSWVLQSTTSRNNEINDLANIEDKRYLLGQTYSVNNTSASFTTASINNELAVDQSFVIPVNRKAPYGENLARYSEEISNISGVDGNGKWNFLGGGTDRLTVIQDVLLAPNRTRTAEEITITAIGNSLRNTMYNHTETVTTTYTVSFWGRIVLDDSANSPSGISFDIIFNDDANASAQAVIQGTDWAFYQYQIDVPVNNAITSYNTKWKTTDNTNIGDKFSIWGVNVSRTPTAPFYQRTLDQATEEEGLFLIAKPVNTTLNVEDFNRHLVEDQVFVQDAINFVALRKDVNTVKLSENKIFRAGITIPERGVNLEGTYISTQNDDLDFKGTIIYLDLNDENREMTGITFENEDNAGNLSGVSLKNLLLVPISEARAAVNMGDAYECVIENVKVKNFDEGRLIDFGFLVGKTTNFKANKLTAEDCEMAGIRFDTSSTIEIHKSRFHDCGNGIDMIAGTSLHVYDVICEQNDTSAIIFNGAFLSLQNFYVEDCPADPLAITPSIDIRSAQYLRIVDSDLKGRDPSVPDGINQESVPDQYLIELGQVGTALIASNRMLNSTAVLKTVDTTGEVTVMNNFINMSKRQLGEDWEGDIFDRSRVNFIGNIIEENSGNNINYSDRLVGNFIQRFTSTEAMLDESFISTSHFTSPTIYDDWQLNSPLVTSRNENLLKYSDNMDLGWRIKTTDFSVTTGVDQNGESGQATNLTYLTNAIQHNILFDEVRGFADVLEIGDTYTVSFWGRQISLNNQTNENTQISLLFSGSNVISSQTITLTDQWVKYVLTGSVIEEPEANANWIKLRVNAQDLDVFALSDLQVEKNPFAGPYVATDGTPVLSNPTLRVNDDDTFVIDGNFQTEGLSLGFTKVTTPLFTVDQESVILVDVSQAATINLPLASTVSGKTYIIKNLTANNVSIQPSTGETIDGQSNADLTNAYEILKIISDGSNWFEF